MKLDKIFNRRERVVSTGYTFEKWNKDVLSRELALPGWLYKQLLSSSYNKTERLEPKKKHTLKFFQSVMFGDNKITTENLLLSARNIYGDSISLSDNPTEFFFLAKTAFNYSFMTELGVDTMVLFHRPILGSSTFVGHQLLYSRVLPDGKMVTDACYDYHNHEWGQGTIFIFPSYDE